MMNRSRTVFCWLRQLQVSNAGGSRQFPKRRRRKEQALSRNALKSIVLPLIMVCLACAFPALFMMRRAGPDLFDFTPKSPRLDGYTLVAWCDLERGHGALKEGGPSAGSPTRVLGYMMDGDKPVRDGTHVNRFVLLPDAGSAVHPAHRFGDQMIDVQLRPGSSIVFKGSSLVWAFGTWKVLSGNPAGDRPLYQLQDAEVENADKTDIPKYFR